MAGGTIEIASGSAVDSIKITGAGTNIRIDGATMPATSLRQRRPHLIEARARLRARAETLGWSLEPIEAGLCVEVDGRLVNAEVNGSWASIRLPDDAQAVTLVSESFVPNHVSRERGDRRRLGIMLKEVVVSDRDGRRHAIPLESGRLTSGFHPIETSSGGALRWTDGRATLDVSALMEPGAAVSVALRFASKAGAHQWNAPLGPLQHGSRVVVSR